MLANVVVAYDQKIYTKMCCVKCGIISRAVWFVCVQNISYWYILIRAEYHREKFHSIRSNTFVQHSFTLHSSCQIIQTLQCNSFDQPNKYTHTRALHTCTKTKKSGLFILCISVHMDFYPFVVFDTMHRCVVDVNVRLYDSEVKFTFVFWWWTGGGGDGWIQRCMKNRFGCNYFAFVCTVFTHLSTLQSIPSTCLSRFSCTWLLVTIFFMNLLEMNDKLAFGDVALQYDGIRWHIYLMFCSHQFISLARNFIRRDYIANKLKYGTFVVVVHIYR